jgi:hypothetical protein
MDNTKQSERIKAHVIKTFFVEVFGVMKEKYPRQELVRQFGDKDLTEMEIVLYAEKKKEQDEAHAIHF